MAGWPIRRGRGRNWVRIVISLLAGHGRLTARGLELAEGLDGLVIGAADAEFVARDPFDFIGECELAADFERAGEGIALQPSDAKEPPPMMRDHLDLLRLGFGLRVPFFVEAGQEVIEIGGGFGG